jgi:hypothetical protein
MMFVAVDDPVPPNVLQLLLAFDGIKEARVLELPTG